MLRKILLPTIFVILAWGFWASPDFKTIAAGVSIFLFGMLSLDHLRLSMHEHCDLFNSRLATAMTDGRMSGELATSLLNDSIYGQLIFSKLVDVAETLFVRHSRSLTEAEREVMLSDDELQALES